MRAFFPLWFFLYLLQPLVLPIIARETWLSRVLGNSLYLVACGYYVVISFVGYNELPSLQGTEPLLLPLPALVLGWLASIFTINIPRHLAPVLWAGIKLRRPV